MRQRLSSPHRSQLLAQRAGCMRAAAATPSEELLWQKLRGRQLGVSFKRQVPVGGRFIVDFWASSAKLVVEVDGPYHARHASADGSRDRALARLGYSVLRLDAELVIRDLPGALSRIRAALDCGMSHL
jgi:very-short-patch-repair endonuclease